MDWTKVVTNPLGLAGFALALVFGAVGRVMAQKRVGKLQWIVPAAFTLAAISVLGGLVLAYQHTSTTSETKSPAATPAGPSMSIGKIDQKADNGAAVAGVQGAVTINKTADQKELKPQR